MTKAKLYSYGTEFGKTKTKNDQRKNYQAQVSQKMRLYFLNDFAKENENTLRVLTYSRLGPTLKR